MLKVMESDGGEAGPKATGAGDVGFAVPQYNERVHQTLSDAAFLCRMSYIEFEAECRTKRA
jgi:hypothetical protein